MHRWLLLIWNVTNGMKHICTFWDEVLTVWHLKMGGGECQWTKMESIDPFALSSSYFYPPHPLFSSDLVFSGASTPSSPCFSEGKSKRTWDISLRSLIIVAFLLINYFFIFFQKNLVDISSINQNISNNEGLVATTQIFFANFLYMILL